MFEQREKLLFLSRLSCSHVSMDAVTLVLCEKGWDSNSQPVIYFHVRQLGQQLFQRKGFFRVLFKGRNINGMQCRDERNKLVDMNAVKPKYGSLA